MTLVDRTDFHTFGDGVWWAVVTLGTVGYGDIVPHTGWGRVLGSVVIVAGVTFLSFLTATVTSLFVSAARAGADREDRRATRRERGGDARRPQTASREARGDRGQARPRPFMRPSESWPQNSLQPRARHPPCECLSCLSAGDMDRRAWFTG
jgi:ion channel